MEEWRSALCITLSSAPSHYFTQLRSMAGTHTVNMINDDGQKQRRQRRRGGAGGRPGAQKIKNAIKKSGHSVLEPFLPFLLIKRRA